LPAKKVLITGSNARLMSRELATYLTGRHIDFTLFPFSFREFLKYRGIEIRKEDLYSTRSAAKLKDLFMNYLETGGFPEAMRLGRLFLLENFRDIVERDVIQRYRPKYSSKLKELAKYLVSNPSCEMTYSKLKNIFSLGSVNTIAAWISYLENSYLVFKLERFSPKLKEAMLAPKKVLLHRHRTFERHRIQSDRKGRESHGKLGCGRTPEKEELLERKLGNILLEGLPTEGG